MVHDLVARAIRNAIRANRFARLKPLFFIVRQADSHESLEFPIRANHLIQRSTIFGPVVLTWEMLLEKIHICQASRRDLLREYSLFGETQGTPFLEGPTGLRWAKSPIANR